MLFKRANFIERSITSALSFLKESVFSDECASKKGFLQARESRIKVGATILFLVLILLIKDIYFLAGIYLVCLVLVWRSNINLGFFLVRTWIFIPLFSLFIAMPALFNIFTPGEALFNFKFLGLGFIITKQGLYSAVLFVMRVINSVSFSILLALTTRHTHLLKVLRIFRVPPLFVMTLGMCYRYLYLFVSVVENTYLAIKSRCGLRLHYRKGQEIVGCGMANLWHRSYHLSNQVYIAMVSRGYKGEPKVLDEVKVNFKDLVWLGFVVAFFILTMVLYG